ncbi:hypothetical protein RN001_014100 [Aquatica leii]|uniref:Uncharacterized protein n=1 Tax=Aquatica leii TaxID=1421715 RepID=A0AAN7SNZ3_9COLE|nr:hypothetical protein RN001_014100 [Aquatica leii]
MSLKLYVDALSQPSRALLIFLQASNIPFTKCIVKLGAGEHLSEEFKNNISRFQKVPVVIHGDFHLTESVAILRYISRENAAPNNLYPKDSKLQARVDEYLEWQHTNIRANCAMYFRKKWLEPKITGEELSEKLLLPYERRMVDSLNDFENLWLSSGAFITGDTLTAADIWAACEIEQPRIAGYDPESERPVLSRWLNNVRKSLSPHYEEAHTLLNKLVQKSTMKKASSKL